MKKLLAKLLGISLVALYIGTIAIAIFSMVNYNDQIEEIKDAKMITGYSIYDTKKCQIKGCNRGAVEEVYYEISSGSKRFENISVSNKANLTIESGSHEWYANEKRIGTRKYYEVTPNYNGTYDVDAKKEHYEYSVKSDSKSTKHYTIISGYYCSDHINAAVKTIKSELVRELSSDFMYLWGKVLFPWNLIFISWLAIFLQALKFYAEYEEPKELILRKALIIKLPITIVSVLLYFASTKIVVEDIRTYASIFMFLMATIAGCVFWYTIASLVANYKKSKGDKKDIEN